MGVHPRRGPSYARRRIVALGALTATVAIVYVLATTVFGGVNTQGAHVSRYTIHSSLAHGSRLQIAIAPGASERRRPLLVFLHGNGGEPEFEPLGAVRSALTNSARWGPGRPLPGRRADSYWHDRSDGAWGSYVIREAIPQAIRRLQPTLAGSRSAGSRWAASARSTSPPPPRRFCAVGGHSAALWSAAATAPRAPSTTPRTSPATTSSPRARGPPRTGAPVWSTSARGPVPRRRHALARELRADGARVSSTSGTAATAGSYWRRHFRVYVRFYSEALAQCRG